MASLVYMDSSYGLNGKLAGLSSLSVANFEW